MQEEKVLIKSERYDVKKVLFAFIVAGIVSALLLFCVDFSDWWNSYALRDEKEEYDYMSQIYEEHSEQGYCYYSQNEKLCDACKICKRFPVKVAYAFHCDQMSIELTFILMLPLFLIGFLVYFAIKNTEMIVTDKRIYGKVAWGKSVDLPVDSVSAIASIPIWKGLSVSTSSGRISFRAIKNAGEIHSIIINLMKERQQSKAITVSTESFSVQKDEAEELKKFKELLDAGVISQEEFEAKKKQLLGL